MYDSRGAAVGFWRGRYIYGKNGSPIGQIQGSQVHKQSSPYIGEWPCNMVVDKHLGDFGDIGNPGNPGSPGNPGNGGAIYYGYANVFDKLME